MYFAFLLFRNVFVGRNDKHSEVLSEEREYDGVVVDGAERLAGGEFL